MNKKLLIEVNQAWQAEAISNALQNENIEFETIQKAKEYSSIISGIDSLSIDIMVDEKKYIRAAEILKAMSSHAHEETDEHTIRKNYFRRVVIFSMIGVILLPLVFNLVATVNFFNLKKQNVSMIKTWFAGIILILGWAMASVTLGYLVYY